MTHFTTRGSLAALLAWLAACSSPASRVPSPQGLPHPLLVGRFEDDYGIRYAIARDLWIQHPGSRYHIARWRSDAQYLIARNDSANSGDRGLWTRIDWMPLNGMAPFEWAFCMSAYRAPSAAAAESTQVARRDTPRTGCNGHPFSRMKPVR